MSKEGVRSAYWDNIKGFLILLVVFGHVLFQLQGSSAINGIVDTIYMFHMPVFVFVSGFFGKSERSRSFDGVKGFLFLYLIFNSCLWLYNGFTNEFTSILEPIYSYWYLIAIVIWRLVTPHIAKSDETVAVSAIIALCIGFCGDIDNKFALARIIGFYPYYLMGYLLSKESDKALQGRSYTKRAAAGTMFAVTAGMFMFIAYRLFHYTDNALQLLPYDKATDLISRTFLMAISFLMIFAIRFLSVDKEVPYLTMFGRNSLWIFVFHRLFTLWVSDALSRLSVGTILPFAVIATVIICLAFGNDWVAKHCHRLVFDKTVCQKKSIQNAKRVCAAVVSVALVVTFAWRSYDGNKTVSEHDDDVIFRTLSDEQKASFDDAFRLTFAGDLILLEDQVRLGYKDGHYDYSDVFEPAKKYITESDFAISVFEGPMAGESVGYSSSNYDDEKELYLNFPDEFGYAVKDAGFDLVTTANNHLMDKGEAGALRTLDVLDEIGLDHTGSYRQNEQDHVKLVEVQGLKFAVLSYTCGSNYIAVSDFIDGEYAYLTDIAAGTDGQVFEKTKQAVAEDFAYAKSLSPDLIIVLPHMGEQFMREPSEEQKVWCNVFKENGADIILFDHAHAVEPVEITEYNGRQVFTAYCPGNFANSYREHDGDASMLVDVYIDRDGKAVIGGSIVPLYTYAQAGGNYAAVPIYSIMNDDSVRAKLTLDDIDRAAEVHSVITETVFGHGMDISAVTERYYFDSDGFLRTKTSGLNITAEMKQNPFYKKLLAADKICFIGDSVTEGTKNGGCPWYEPIGECLKDKHIMNYSKGGCTVSYMIDHLDEIPDADLYVIALGTNDVRYRDPDVCAMTSEEYVSRIDTLRKGLPDAEFVFIAPWTSTDGDPYCKLSYSEKMSLNESYSRALAEYCTGNGILYIDANPYIKDRLSVSPDRTYLLDHIHPNSSNGVIMYSEAVLSYY